MDAPVDGQMASGVILCFPKRSETGGMHQTLAGPPGKNPYEGHVQDGTYALDLGLHVATSC